MKFDHCLDLENALARALASVQSEPAEGGATEEIVDEVIGLDLVATVLDDFLSVVKKRKDAASKILVERFVDGAQDSVTRRNRTVYLATEYWPGPRIDDLLPEGIDVQSPEYEATVVRVREAAKDRLLRALKSSPDHADLVSETYSVQSLRSALTGKNAQRDDFDVPIVPDALAGMVELNPRTVVRVRRSR
jgi:hypothetical protein